MASTLSFLIVAAIISVACAAPGHLEAVHRHERLHNHVARVYLAGDNSWASPWELHLTQPLPGDMEIALLGLTRLRAFRDGCNEACVVPWWERYVHALLAVVCLPAAAAFLRVRKGGPSSSPVCADADTDADADADVADGPPGLSSSLDPSTTTPPCCCG